MAPEMAAVPVLRPSVGFCVQTVSTASSGGRWYVNMTKHKMCEMPIAYSGKPVSRDFILTHGIGNMQVPFDIGSFRKVKERAEGAKHTTYCIDVVFNPLIVQLFMDDDFCNKMAQFRPFVIGLALKRIEESTGVRLSQDQVKLVKTLRYKDGEGSDGSVPREFADLPGNADCFDEEVPRRSAPPNSDDAEPLIQDITPGVKKPALKKGFLNSSKNAGSLYGDGGSGEGVLPENAGDPMGFIPKKLRQTCKIVDCNSPEYQANEKARRAAEASNKQHKEFTDQLSKDMERWQKSSQVEKWGEDLPDGAEQPAAVKYDNDYSRFNKIHDVEEPKPQEDRDWYYDGTGVRRRMEASAGPVESQGPVEVAREPVIKKGFLDNAKRPLYPKGSEQRAPLSEEEIMKGIVAQAQEMAGETPSASSTAAARAATSSVAKVAAAKAPEYELSDCPEGLQLVVSVPGLESMQDVSLDVTERCASLAFPAAAGLRPLQVELPSSVSPTKVKAKFSKKKGCITVTLPSVGKGA